MIWFDLVTPKSVMFFKNIILELEKRNVEVLVTTRGGEGYQETVELLKLYNTNFVNIGNFGGTYLKDKLKASLERQFEFMEFLSEKKVEKLVCLSSVDANRVAFGLNIPIVNFYDIPLSDYKSDFKKALPQARLSLPLSKIVFKPFVVPDEIFKRFSLEDDQIYTYNFLDPYIWLKDFVPQRGYYEKVLIDLGADISKKTVLIREEEYKSSYVDKKYPFLYEALHQIYKDFDVNIVIIPRYETSYLKKEFPFAYILEQKIVIQHLLKFCDIFIGGGGTINTEATFFGTPTLSTRSFISHYDKYQIDNNLMKWVTTKDELLKEIRDILYNNNYIYNNNSVYKNMSVDMDFIVKKIVNV